MYALLDLKTRRELTWALAQKPGGDRPAYWTRVKDARAALKALGRPEHLIVVELDKLGRLLRVIDADAGILQKRFDRAPD